MLQTWTHNSKVNSVVLSLFSFYRFFYACRYESGHQVSWTLQIQCKWKADPFGTFHCHTKWCSPSILQLFSWFERIEIILSLLAQAKMWPEWPPWIICMLICLKLPNSIALSKYFEKCSLHLTVNFLKKTSIGSTSHYPPNKKTEMKGDKKGKKNSVFCIYQ